MKSIETHFGGNIYNHADYTTPEQIAELPQQVQDVINNKEPEQPTEEEVI